MCGLGVSYRSGGTANGSKGLYQTISRSGDTDFEQEILTISKNENYILTLVDKIV